MLAHSHVSVNSERTRLVDSSSVSVSLGLTRRIITGPSVRGTGKRNNNSLSEQNFLKSTVIITLPLADLSCSINMYVEKVKMHSHLGIS